MATAKVTVTLDVDQVARIRALVARGSASSVSGFVQHAVGLALGGDLLGTPELGTAVQEAATRQGVSVASWLAAAATQQLRNERLGEALDAWEAEDGSFSDAELAIAREALTTDHGRGAA